MTIGLMLIGFGALLLLVHGYLLPAIERSISRRRPASRFAGDTYAAWRQQHRRAGLVGAASVIALGVFMLLLL